MEKMTVTEMESARCSQSAFAKLVGLTRSRVNQLIRAGLIVGDGDGVDVITSLKNFYVFRTLKRFYPDMQPADTQFRRVLMTA